MSEPLDLVEYNRRWVETHSNNTYQAEAARRITALLDALEAAQTEAARWKHAYEMAEPLLTDRDRLAATVERVRELMGRMHEFAHTTGPCGHGCSGCVTARWEHDLRAAIEGTDS